jgi:hypothetical protein
MWRVTRQLAQISKSVTTPPISWTIRYRHVPDRFLTEVGWLDMRARAHRFFVRKLGELVGGDHRAGEVDQLNGERKFESTVGPKQGDLILDLVDELDASKVGQTHISD